MSAEDEEGGESSDRPQSTGKSSKLARFIQAYHSFLSSFVIGVAGLVATSIWQYRQSRIASQQARSEQSIAQTKAENDWLEHSADHLGRTYNARRAATVHERANPPPMIRKVNFCGAAALPESTGGTTL